MSIREFFKRHLLQILLIFIAIQLGIFAMVQTHNTRPQAMADELNVLKDRSAKISPLKNDLDKNEDTLSLASFTPPKHGSVTQKGNVLTYVPNRNYVGEDSLTYTITDGKKKSLAASIVFHVLKNNAPIANWDKTAIFSGETTIINVLDNDMDKEKDSITVVEFTKPLFGEVRLFENKIYYSNQNLSATADSFYYYASDGSSKSNKTLVKVNILKKSENCYPWLALDIGDVSKPGKLACTPAGMMIQASGSDIWNESDGFYFIYQFMRGDCEIIAKVDSLAGSNEWTKAGLMVRENLSSTSKNVFLGLTTKHGIITQARLKSRDSSEGGESKGDLNVPYFIKLSRVGDRFQFAISKDNKKWEDLEGGSVTMSENVYVGIAVTSHDNSVYCKTMLSNYRIKGKMSVIKQP